MIASDDQEKPIAPIPGKLPHSFRVREVFSAQSGKPFADCDSVTLNIQFRAMNNNDMFVKAWILI